LELFLTIVPNTPGHADLGFSEYLTING